jgi:hypothetical protein
VCVYVQGGKGSPEERMPLCPALCGVCGGVVTLADVGDVEGRAGLERAAAEDAHEQGQGLALWTREKAWRRLASRGKGS